ncbi:septum formation family protein [Nocardioides marmoriginsengisoli]|nr:septum formation family protein [Nocardioides marmoriginsengisoli]
MPTTLRALGAVLAIAAVLSGCSAGPKSPADDPAAGKSGIEVPLTTATCWSAATAGADPQEVLSLAKKYGVSYFAAAHALAERPAFDLTQGCAGSHQVEVYKAVAMDQVKPVVTTYTALLQSGSKAYAKLAANVEQACMNKPLLEAVVRTGLPGAVMSPVFGDGVTLGWAPPSPEQWEAGQRVYACTMTQKPAGTLRYASVFRKSFPTSRRTCIDNKALVYVDCARKHNREQISTIDVSAAVAAKKFPGRKAIKPGPDGEYVDVSPALYAALDRACTAYLRAVSTTKKLTGIAEIDPDKWPAPDGTYPVACEADTATTKNPITTQGSVFDR